MSSKSKLRSHYLIYGLMFFLAINIKSIYVPLAIAVAFVNADHIYAKVFNQAANKFWVLLTFTSLAYILIIFGIGSNHLTISKPVDALFVMLFQFLSITILFKEVGQVAAIKYMASYLFGCFALSIYIVYYSFTTDPIAYGYGKLLSPFNNEEINTPGISNQLALFSIFILHFLVKERKIIFKIVLTGLFSMAIIAAIFLGGRAFFFLLGITGLVYLLNSEFRGDILSKSNLIGIIAAIMISVLFGWLKFNEIERYTDLILIRFGLMESSYIIADASRYDTGLKSERFDMYASGLKQMIFNPMGGFGTYGYETLWFHNIFLDSARVAGWLPVFLLISQLLILATLVTRSNAVDSWTIKWFVIAAFIIMQQDVIMEGNYKIYFLFLMALYTLAQGSGRSRSVSLMQKHGKGEIYINHLTIK